VALKDGLTSAVQPATTEDYKELVQLDQLVLTPHLGATTQEVVRGSTILAVENCARHLKGLPLDHRAA
jgi:phosphoglycerate dehydrogenase-like enzyme